METKDRALELRNIILNERSSYSDKTGSTPLILRGDFYKKLSQTDSEKIEEIKAIILLLDYLNTFETEDFSHLFSYITIGNLYNSELIKEFENYIYILDKSIERQNSDERKEALKRSYLIDFLKNIDEFFLNQSLIETQHLIKRYYPWNYAELLTYASIEKGTDLIRELFKQKVRYSIIYNNREIWLKKYGSHLFNQYVVPLKEFLDDDDKVDFDKFCEQNNVVQLQPELLPLLTAFCNFSFGSINTLSRINRGAVVSGVIPGMMHKDEEILRLYGEAFYGEGIPDNVAGAIAFTRKSKRKPNAKLPTIHIAYASTSPAFTENLNKVTAEFDLEAFENTLKQVSENRRVKFAHE